MPSTHLSSGGSHYGFVFRWNLSSTMHVDLPPGHFEVVSASYASFFLFIISVCVGSPPSAMMEIMLVILEMFSDAQLVRTEFGIWQVSGVVTGDLVNESPSSCSDIFLVKDNN